MEQRRHSGTPVKLNALLIGEKTVPKGCRVMNVSSHGMLLHCEPDGRPRTFSDGDSVDIHLTVQHEGEQKKLTIPSHVRHVADNSIDVEFHHPDQVLLDLIESYRTSHTHKLEAAVGDAHTDQKQPDIIPIHSDNATHSPDLPRQQTHHWSSRRRLLYTGLFVTIAAVLSGTYFYISGLDNRIDNLEVLTDKQHTALASMQDKLFSASLLEGRYASIDARISALGDAFSTLDDKISPLVSHSVVAEKQVIKPGSTPQTASSTTPATRTENIARVASEKITATATPPANQIPATPDNTIQRALNPAPATPDESVAEVTPADITTTDSTPALQAPATRNLPAAGSGPWVINFMSSRDKNYVEQFAQQARTLDVPLELNSASIKGKTYWRLQITGLESLKQAKIHAAPIKARLGIEDVWYLKRK